MAQAPDKCTSPARSADLAKSSSSARVLTPRDAAAAVPAAPTSGPFMVNVFPLPVCPYAKMHTL